MAGNTLAPGLLLAAPRLGDPNFEHTVVLLGRHDERGSLGWVINGKPIAPVGELLENAGLVPAGVTLPHSEAFRRVARAGGPVATNTGWLLYRTLAVPVPGEIDIGDAFAITGDTKALEASMRGAEPREFRLLLGYAGWGPGQLEEELQQGAWLPANVNAKLLFDTAPDEIWNAAYRAAIGTMPAAFTSTRRGSA